MKQNYIKQRGKFDCACVAIHNAFIWAGKRVNYSASLCYYKEVLGYIDRVGVYPEDFHKVILESPHLWPFKVNYHHRNPTVEQICANVGGNNAVIIGVVWEYNSHIMMITDATEKYVTVINYDKKKAVQRISKKRLEKEIKFGSVIYCIEKSEAVS